MSKVYQQIGDFQNKFRDYFIRRLTDVGIDPNSVSRDNRDRESRQLEFRDFKNFILSNKHVFRDDFGFKVNNLPTWLDDLREIRNKVAHYAEVTSEDEKEAEILIKKIAGFANFSAEYPDTDFPEIITPLRAKVIVSKAQTKMSDPDLDSVLATFPVLSKEPTYSEYKIRRNDLGTGSIWIRKQRDGYRIVTTGNAHCVDAELERLTGRSPKIWKDRNHCGWKSLELETVRTIFQYYSLY